MDNMTTNQFKSYIRLVLDDLHEIKAKAESAEAIEKIEKLIANLQATLED